MSNEFYTASGNPATGSQGASAVIRSEYSLIVAAFDKLPTMTGNGLYVVRINAGGTALESISASTLVDIAGYTNAATSKPTPVDADEMPLADSATSFTLKKLTWANLKATMFSSWGVLIAAATTKATPVDADALALADSAAANATKQLTWANIKATMFTSWGALIAAGTPKATPVDGDMLALADSAAANATKQLSWANIKATLKTYFDTLYTNATGDVTGQASSVDSEIALFSSTTGKVIKRATNTGMLKASSGVIATATAGTDYADPTATTTISGVWSYNDGSLKLTGATSGASTLKAPAIASTYVHTLPAATSTIAAINFAQTWTAKQSFVGTSALIAAALTNAVEPATVSATAATGTINYDVSTQSILYYTSSAAANWTVNFRHSSGTSLNTSMATGDVLTATFAVTQGGTPYYASALQVDGNSVTPKYGGGAAYTTGTASGIDSYTYTIIKTGNAAFTVLVDRRTFA